MIRFNAIAIATLAWALSAFGADQTWKGQISDAMCGANHQAMAKGDKKVDPHECTLACTKSGSKYVFVSDGKVFDIANQDLADLKTHAGRDVTLTGELGSDGKTVTVSKITM